MKLFFAAILTGAFISQVYATTINFDDLTAPNLFKNTVALTEYYSPLGVHFQGPGQGNGGAILDAWAGNWAVAAHSGKNMLGFNRTASLSGGGLPIGPETITFDTLVTNVSIYVVFCDWPQAVSFRISAYDAPGNLIDFQETSMAHNTWSGLGISSVSGIKKFVVEGVDVPTVVGYGFDDLSFTSVPEPATFFLLGLGAAIAVRKQTRSKATSPLRKTVSICG